MPQLNKIVDDAADQVVSALEQAENATVAIVGQVTETVAKYLPDFDIKPEEIVSTGFDVSKKVVNVGRDATLSLLGQASKPAAKAKAPAKV